MIFCSFNNENNNKIYKKLLKNKKKRKKITITELKVEIDPQLF